MDEPQKTTSIDELLNELTKSQSPTPPMPIPNLPPVDQNIKPAPKPVSPLPVPSRPTSTPMPPREYQSSIRTMSGDISNLKSGQAPAGIDVKKTPGPAVPIKPAHGPSIPPPPPKPIGPVPKVSLGDAEKSGPLKQQIPTPSIPVKLQPVPTVTVPPAGSKPKKGMMPILLTVLGLLIIGTAAYWYFGLRSEPEIVIESPTPLVTESATPTPEVKKLSEYFPSNQVVTIPGNQDPLKYFLNTLKTMTIQGGQFNRLNAVIGSESLTFETALQRFLLKYPNELAASFGTESSLIGYGQQEVYANNQRSILANNNPVKLVLISESVSGQTVNSMRAWETTMTSDLNPLFSLKLQKDAQFMDNTYAGVSIRYINGRNPDVSIDYAVITASNNKSYLVIAGSREAIYGAIDKLRQP